MLHTGKIKDIFKQSQSGTLSPMTTTTTSSGYSTGSSSISATAIPSLKKSFSPSTSVKKQQQQQSSSLPLKSKPKGLQNLFLKLKNLFLTPSKVNHGRRTMRPVTTRQISSSNILRQYHQDTSIYDVLPSSSLVTSKTISLPFTYYHTSSIRSSRTNFEQISAWLNDSRTHSRSSQQEPSISLSSIELDQPETNVVMKTTSSNIKPPRRSTSLVTKITRPIMEQPTATATTTTTTTGERTNSSTSSFGSSILTRGMSEHVTPPTSNDKSKSNHRRTIDFSRRRTLASTTEKNSNKENVSSKASIDNPYRFPSSSSKPPNELQPTVPKHKVTKEYYFHSQGSEDLLNNSYGLTLLQQQQKQQQPSHIPRPLQPRHSVEAVLMISQLPKISSFQQPAVATPMVSPSTGPALDSLEDLLCDREVESYFYPVSSSSFQSEHIYMNLSTPVDQYQALSPSFDYLHGTLC